jgi:hypothetical protein
MPMIFVTPAKGARVRMPERNSTVMAEEGAWVPDTVHYAQLRATGDIVLADPQPAMPVADRTEPTRPADPVPARVPAASSKEK